MKRQCFPVFPATFQALICSRSIPEISTAGYQIFVLMKARQRGHSHCPADRRSALPHAYGHSHCPADRRSALPHAYGRKLLSSVQTLTQFAGMPAILKGGGFMKKNLRSLNDDDLHPRSTISKTTYKGELLCKPQQS